MSKERFLTVLVPIKDGDCEATVYADATALENAVPPSASNIDKIYKLQDGTYMRAWLNPSANLYEYRAVSDREFPYIGNPLEIFDFTYDATRMGTAPTISAQGVMRYAAADGTTLDGLWTQQCHVVFNGKKLFLKQIPTSSRSNEDARYKYDLDFVDETSALERVYFYDVVSPFITARPISESSVFSFYGDISELAKRINASLIRSGLASLTRKQVYYNGYPKIVPYLTYEQWTIFNVDPERLYQDGIFEGQDEMMAFYNIYSNECHGDYNLYLMGYIYENTNGVYDLSGYQCKIGKDKHGNQSTSEEKLITFDNNTIHEALQQFHDTFELEYYITSEKDSNGNFTGNTWIMVADCEHDFADLDESSQDFERDEDGIPISTNPFEYGDTEALISKEKTNTTDKIVTRITGVGSTENIPWYYPNPNPDGWIKPFFTREGQEQSEVTIDYPTDEGTSSQEYIRYERYLKNRLGKPLKKGGVKSMMLKGDASNVGIYATETDYKIYSVYNIDASGLLNPRITLEFDLNPTESKCYKIIAKLLRDGSEIEVYDSSQTYTTPTDFQSLFIHKDGKHKMSLVVSALHVLEINYYIRRDEMPASKIFDYEGYHYNSLARQVGSTGVYAYIGQNFYEVPGLLPYVKYKIADSFVYIYDTGFSTNGEYDGKVPPMPRVYGKRYRNKSNGIIYECYDSNATSIYNGTHRYAFTESPIMDRDEWLNSFVFLELLLWANDGWYLDNKKIELYKYGLDYPRINGDYILTDIFDCIEFQRLKWVTPMQNLMPEVFIKTDGERRFYNAHDYYPLQEGTADTTIGEEQAGSNVRNPIYKEEETDPDDKHYDFESEYRQQMPHEHIENFDDVKPSIKEQTNTINGSVIRIDVVETFDYDTTDNNEIWDNNEEDTIQGDYKHPYFFAKLRPLGFNIFDLATTEDMVLSMTTGNCGACNFKIGVDERTGKNPVQIWEQDVFSLDSNGTYTRIYEGGTLRRYIDLNGLYYHTEEGYVPVSSNMMIEGGGIMEQSSNLFESYTYSEESVEKGLVGGVKQYGKRHFQGDVVTSGKFIDSQQDTSENYVWVALMKDTESYGVIMPSAIPDYNDPTCNQYIEPKGIFFTNRINGETSELTEDQADKFVLTNIRLPQIYLRRAERKLSRELVKYMYEHNWQRFNFSIKFSRIYIEGDPKTDDNLNENSVLYVKYDGKTYRQYAKHYTYKMSHDVPLPEINVDMNEDLSVSRTMTQQWDRKLAKSGRVTVSYVGKVNNQTRDMSQKHYVGKYDSLSQSKSEGQVINNYTTNEIEWEEL